MSDRPTPLTHSNNLFSIPLRLLFFSSIWCLPVFMTGCTGEQSTLNSAGHEAEQIADLFWIMLVGAIAIWTIVIGLAYYAIRIQPQPHHLETTKFWVIGGGAVFPTVVLTVLLMYGLSMMPGLLAPAPEGSLRIEVTGLQWWWRVEYQLPDQENITLANEIRLPVGQPVQFDLKSADVIHAFWIPSLGGKVDMIPGRQTRLTLHPTKTGTYRGACAEYCGGSHALMNFYVIVMEPAEYQNWLETEARPATTPTTEQAIRGQELFVSYGCGACHTVRGLVERSVIGPDLTHVGSRHSLGAGILENETDILKQWIAHPAHLKPEVLMPDFAMLPEDELHDLVTYLEGLK